MLNSLGLKLDIKYELEKDTRFADHLRKIAEKS
jgi:hypothetical protein